MLQFDPEKQECTKLPIIIIVTIFLPPLRPYNSILMDMCRYQLSGLTRTDRAFMAGWR